MCAGDNFACFSALPPELRLLVWEHALSVWTVWAAAPNSAAGSHLTANRLPFTMAFVGPVPYLAGLSCREARRLLERSYVKPVLGPRGTATIGDVYWVDLKKTVVYLGGGFNAIAVLDSFSAGGLSKFEHVGLSWYRFQRLARTCQRLAALCPGIRTVIIQRSESEIATNNSTYKPLSLETAAGFANIAEKSGPELGYEQLDTHHLRALLLDYFGDSPPMFHLLPPGSV
ncbi:hypothetical protein BU26DRAFT_176574 [Trematosphaeria pertusa]|uniref:Uncharacterized protein n=1 Tax=Trematosphaeria pertusa TaxID=390896 RepID=A0A6A6HU81_9PLEO|nr:uncharacterized protein BU26DRAFT_176574 [Trematosphaeria pertusa]KAF2241342.1 hypothetical protein BU26DRAFT_176574 [Trematosphaeria pertusa]